MTTTNPLPEINTDSYKPVRNAITAVFFLTMAGMILTAPVWVPFAAAMTLKDWLKK